MASEMTDDEILHQVVEKLKQKYPDRPAKEIEKIAREEFSQLLGRPVRDFLSVLTERAAKQRLKAK